MKKSILQIILKVIIAIASTVAGALGLQVCYHD